MMAYAPGAAGSLFIDSSAGFTGCQSSPARACVGTNTAIAHTAATVEATLLWTFMRFLPHACRQSSVCRGTRGRSANSERTWQRAVTHFDKPFAGHYAPV